MNDAPCNWLDFHLRTRLLRGPGTFARLGELAEEYGMRRVLLVTDPGLLAAGYPAQARQMLEARGLVVSIFAGVVENPTAIEVEACRQQAERERIDGFIGLGGGSSLDTARGCNFVLTQGGSIHDYWGSGKAHSPMLPMIAVPTTAGTGSEVQSYALISDPVTHRKMACGDPKAAAVLALLDPELTLSQPALVTAQTGLDTAVHALEALVSRPHTPLSDMFARESFGLTRRALGRVLSHPRDLEARGEMQWAACLAGLAIENSMLGCAHAAANPLTARYGLAHGQAVACVAPSVLRRNAAVVGEAYEGVMEGGGEALARWLEDRMVQAGLPLCPERLCLEDVPELALQAEQQWTAQFNPVSLNFEEIYRDVLSAR